MQCDEAAHEGEPHPEAAFRAFHGTARLGERGKEPRHDVLADADAVVAHADEDVICLAYDAQLNLPIGVGVLCRVDQQIAEDLRETHRIGVETHGLLRQVELQRVTLGIEQRSG